LLGWKSLTLTGIIIKPTSVLNPIELVALISTADWRTFLLSSHIQGGTPGVCFVEEGPIFVQIQALVFSGSWDTMQDWVKDKDPFRVMDFSLFVFGQVSSCHRSFALDVH